MTSRTRVALGGPPDEHDRRRASRRWVPVIDRGRCEAGGTCVDACPEGVLEVRRTDDEDLIELSWLGKLKSWSHCDRSAYATALERCTSCSRCADACPEGAISMVPKVPQRGLAAAS